MIINPNEPVQQPIFPQIGVNISSQGITLNLILAPGFVFQVALNEEQMNQLMQEWIKTRQDIQNTLSMIEHVKKSKIN